MAGILCKGRYDASNMGSKGKRVKVGMPVNQVYRNLYLPFWRQVRSGNRGTTGLGRLERLAPCQTGDFPPDGTGFRHVAALSRLALKELQVISVSANPCLFRATGTIPDQSVR